MKETNCGFFTESVFVRKYEFDYKATGGVQNFMQSKKNSNLTTFKSFRVNFYR